MVKWKQWPKLPQSFDNNNRNGSCRQIGDRYGKNWRGYAKNYSGGSYCENGYFLDEEKVDTKETTLTVTAVKVKLAACSPTEMETTFSVGKVG